MTEDVPPPRAGARPGALLVVRITPADVGQRVSIRYRLDATTLTDVVGRLVSWTSDGVVSVERRDGAVVDVAEAALVAGKVVPDAPARRGGDTPRQ